MMSEADHHPGAAGAQWPRGARTLLVVVLLAAIYLAYAPALDGEFQFDDIRGIANYAPVRDIGRFERGDFSYLAGAGRWLVDLTFSLNYRLSGFAVRPYHLVNLALHLVTVLAVLGFGLLLLRRARWPDPFVTAWLAAALFGLHPLQSEAVAYVSQRAEVLATLLYLGALCLALRADEETRFVRTAAALVAALICVVAGWGAKPTVATFPAAWLLAGAAFPARGSLRRRLIVSLPFWAVTGFLIRRLFAAVSGTAHAGFDVPSLGPRSYFLTQGRVILTYLRLLVWPAGQNVDWDFPISASAFEPRTALALLAVATILAAAAWLWVWSARSGPSDPRTLARLWAFGILWFFVILAPTSSIVPVSDVLAEHRLYPASFGIFLPAAATGVLAARRFAKSPSGILASAAAALGICIALGVALHRRAQVWESAISLWSDSVAKSPHKPRPHMNLGYALTPVDPNRAIDEYRLALQLADGTVRPSELKQNLAGALLRLHRSAEAIAILEELAETETATPEFETNLAIACLESGRLAEAQAAAARAAARFPTYAPAWHTLGQLAFSRGDYAGAERHFAQAVTLDPDSTVSLSSLAVTEEKLGKRAAACSTWARYMRTAGAAIDAARERSTALGCN